MTNRSRIPCRMTPEEKARIETRAKAAGLSASAYLLRCALAPRGGRIDPVLFLARCDRGLGVLERIAAGVESGGDPERLRILRRLEIMEG